METEFDSDKQKCIKTVKWQRGNIKSAGGVSRGFDIITVNSAGVVTHHLQFFLSQNVSDDGLFGTSRGGRKITTENERLDQKEKKQQAEGRRKSFQREQSDLKIFFWRHKTLDLLPRRTLLCFRFRLRCQRTTTHTCRYSHHLYILSSQTALTVS